MIMGNGSWSRINTVKWRSKKHALATFVAVSNTVLRKENGTIGNSVARDVFGGSHFTVFILLIDNYPLIFNNISRGIFERIYNSSS